MSYVEDELQRLERKRMLRRGLAWAILSPFIGIIVASVIAGLIYHPFVLGAIVGTALFGMAAGWAIDVLTK